MTTRKRELLNRLGYNQPYCLQILSNEDALSLFCQHALGDNNFDLHPALKPHGEAIVKKCGGLPLALIALGSLLRTKANEEWEVLMNSEIWEVPKQIGIILALILSYQDLPINLKGLFAYCSLFPKDYVFDRDQLVLLWTAEGFLIHPPRTNTLYRRTLESYGHEYFEELLSKSFFQQVSSDKPLYVMHHGINDLATFVARDFFFRLDTDMNVNVMNEALEKYRHMSFTCPTHEVYEKFRVFQKAKSLRTLLAVSVAESRRRFSLSNKILVELLPMLPLLRVLNLSDLMISHIPDSIGSLKHLRYLNLSRTEITHLPNQVGDLHNLQTMLMCGCQRLEKLSDSFLKLKNLRHVDISDTPLLKKIPLGIGELKSLQTMSKIIIERSNGFGITELKNLNDLHGRLSIKRLDKIKNAMEAKEANLFKKELDELEMEWSDSLDDVRNGTLEEDVFNMLKPCHDKLRKLEIVSYGGTKFPSWVGDPSFYRLEHVTIRGCKKCTYLPPLGQLSFLKELFVANMRAVKVVGSELLGDANRCGGVAFPSLEILSFVDMQGWEAWSINIGAFPRIRELRIEHCHNLVEASLEALPSLRLLEIVGCRYDVLRNIVHGASSIIKLVMGEISGLTHLDGGVIECLGAVEVLEISDCHGLRYMWDSEVEASKILMNLRRLVVKNCSNLMSLREKEDVNCGSGLTCLREMKIELCNKLERFSCPNSIEKLDISRCGSITCIYFPEGGQKLKTLMISECDKLSEVFLNNSFSSLEGLHIRGWLNLKPFPDSSWFVHLTRLVISDCKNLISFPDLSCSVGLTSLTIQNCKNMTSFRDLSCLVGLTSLTIQNCRNMISFPDLSCLVGLTSFSISRCENLKSFSDLSRFVHITSLSIINCKNLMSFPDDQLPSLTSLTDLTIIYCPSMEESFPRGLWPPNLSSLSIGGLKKPISKWGPQNFPTSLVTLYLVGEDVDSSSQFSHDLLPSSLITLFITEFEKLESLSNGLQHLTSLQLLSIWFCPMLTDLPETLLPQLLHLHIHNCPTLEERCSNFYGPHISHIPLVSITRY